MACPDENVLVAMLERAEPGGFADLEDHLGSCESCRQVVAAAARADTFAMGTPQPSSLGEPMVDVEIGDRYVIDALLGRGGMGSVYLARDLQLGREVALKLHRVGSGDDRLQREAIAMAKLAHPNVVTVFEVTSIDDQLCVAMEYVRGDTLRGWLAKTKRGWRDIVAMLIDAGTGLAAAHAAGLVHRDFKPENVLVGDDGRPRVSDFGLARVGAHATPSPPPRATTKPTAVSQSLDTPLTITGSLLGTPAYMAPEQLAGDAVDVRSDQFSFCVVAWESLYGRRPFAGTTLTAIQLAIEAHELTPPGRTVVPDRVRRVIERGLAAEPAERFADLDALLAALRAAARPRTRRRSAFAAAAIVVLAGGGLAAASAIRTHRHAAECEAAGDDVRESFGGLQRAAAAQAFAASGAPYAASAFDHATQALDLYRELLAVRTTATCQEASDDHLAVLRRSCLTDRRNELASLVDVFEHADVQTVEGAGDAAWAMFDPAPCDDPSTLLATAPRSVHSAELGKVRALFDAGRYREAIAVAEPLAELAHAQGDADAELAVLDTLGQLQAEVDPPAKAAATFDRALALAETHGRDLDAALLLGGLASVVGVTQHDHASAHRDLDLAFAKLDRLGGHNSLLRASLLATNAQLLMDENRAGEAETAIVGAVAALEQVFGPDHPRVAAALGTQSQIERAEGKLDKALETSQRTLAIFERTLGEGHPDVAGSELNLASALIVLHRYDEARPLLQRADAVLLAVYGPDSAPRAAIYGNLGEVEQAQEHFDAALADYRGAAKVLEHIGDLGGQAGADRDIARVLAQSGHLPDAIAEDERALATIERLGSGAESRLAGVLAELADLHIDAHEPAVALPLAERAVSVASARPADADPDALAESRFALGVALWDSGRDRDRALALVAQARDGYVDAGRRGDATTWLAERTHGSR